MSKKKSIKQVLELTGLTKKEYETLIFQIYLNCLSKASKSPMHLQKLLTCRRINAWFLDQIEYSNKKYVSLTLPYKHLDKESLKSTYISEMNKLVAIYPSALLKGVKSNNSSISNN